MQIGVLGSFEVRTDDGGVADVPGARLRALLIALALSPGRVVSRTALVEWIWGEHPPADAANALQRLASRLRKALPGDPVEGLAGGYRLTLEPDTVDALRFERLVARAGEREGPERLGLLREALALWRGRAMQEVEPGDSPALEQAARRLEERRLSALEDRFEAETALGTIGGSIAELTDAAAANPMRERLAAALMRAHAAAGRDTDALLVYERTREALADALGLDPSPELSALHVSLLRGELRQRDQPRRTNLRAELTSFVGRESDIAAVRELLSGYRLTTLIGPGGAGKTRLATDGHARPDPRRRLDGRVRPDRRGRRRGADRAGGARAAGCPRRRHERRRSRRGSDRRDPRPRDAADPGQLRARDRAGGHDGGAGAARVSPAADRGDHARTARHHRRGAVARRTAGAARGRRRSGRARRLSRAAPLAG